ncbi:hypothetical protein IWW56_005093 [Coemansia sp. RSA 2131]|nr:hypothetical protein IWW56_005093 [Coemansia sp. RSA 2131]
MADYYELLGVSSTASEAEIRTAYMKKALSAHPDRNPSPTATQEFQQIADAYYTLSDPMRRSTYDQSRPRSKAHADSHADAESVFGDVFSDMLHEEVGSAQSGTLWSTLGMVGGSILGFILANIPGAFIGAFAGCQIGKVRDRTGRAVYDSFKELPHARKAQVLAALAAQVLGTGSK